MLDLTQINKPILLRRLFQLSCNYSSQILSYQKMLADHSPLINQGGSSNGCIYKLPKALGKSPTTS
jgi:hypothetical protein